MIIILGLIDHSFCSLSVDRINYGAAPVERLAEETDL